MWKKSFGVIAMAGCVGAAALGGNGCSSSSDANPNDAGTDAKPRPDGGDTDGAVACKPADVSAFTPRWQPPGVTPGACSAAQIDAFVTACFVTASTPSTCDTFRKANAACDKCVVTRSDAAKLGVIVVPPTGLPTFNIAGCLAITAGDLSAGSCGAKEQGIEQCVETACADNCPIPTSDVASDPEISDAIDAFDNCENDAAANGCTAFDTAAAGCVPDLVDSGPSSKCIVDRNDPNHDTILAKNLMEVICGGAAADGGGDAAPDAPADAADGGG